MNKKYLIGGNFKSTKAADIADGFIMAIKGYASTSDVDRTNDIVLPSAFNSSIGDFMKFPVLLLNHSWDSPPVGRIFSYSIDDKGLMIEAQIVDTPAGQEVKTLIEAGLLKSFSIGFNIKKVERSSEPGDPTILTDIELLEISIVNVPANMAALIENAQAKGITLKTITSSSEGWGTKGVLTMKKDEVSELVDKKVADVNATVADVKGSLDKLDGIVKAMKDVADRSESEKSERLDRVIDDFNKVTKTLEADIKAVKERKLISPRPYFGIVDSKAALQMGTGEVEGLGSDSAAEIKAFRKINDDLIVRDAMLEANSKANGGEYHLKPRNVRMTELKGYQRWAEFQKALDTATNSEGGFTVPTETSSRILEKVRIMLKVGALHEEIPCPTPTFKVPVDVGDTVGTLAGETTSAVSAFNTVEQDPTFGQLTFATKKCRGRTQISEELTEDAAIAMTPFVVNKVSNSIARAQERAIINGQQTADIDTGGGGVGATDFRKAYDGYRYHGEQVATSKVDLNTWSETNLSSMEQFMGAYALNPASTVWVCSPNTYLKHFLAMTNVRTLDKYGVAATILQGELAKYNGKSIIVSEYVQTDLNATGIYDAVTTNLSVIALVHTPSWFVGTYGGIRLSTQYWALDDVWNVVAYKRHDFKPFQALSTTYTHTSIGYNITT